MPIETIASNAKLKRLAASWSRAKEEERDAQARRLGIESQIIAELGDEIPEKGSVRVEALKITCGYNDKWDQEKIQEIRSDWPDTFPDFPFREELKPDGKSLSYMREHEPDAYELATTALIQEPRKPAFTLD